MNEIFGFVWKVPRRGYVVEWEPDKQEWELDIDEDITQVPMNPFLWDGIDQQQSDPDRDYFSYAPLTECKALFRRFSQLNGSEESIIQFANKYGRLGGRVEEYHYEVIDCETQVLKGIKEPLVKWREQIKWVKDFLSLWDAYDKRDLKLLDCALGRMRHHQLDGEMSVWTPGNQKAFESERLIIAEMDRSKHGSDPFAVAKYLLWMSVNTELSQTTSPEMNWDPGAGMFVLQIVPSSLLGTIWLQIARAVAGENTYHQCEGCGEWFEIHPDVARSDKRYCSNACRNRIYRKNKKRATDLFNQGSSIENISQELKSETARINKWIAEANNSARD